MLQGAQCLDSQQGARLVPNAVKSMPPQPTCETANCTCETNGSQSPCCPRPTTKLPITLFRLPSGSCMASMITNLQHSQTFLFHGTEFSRCAPNAAQALFLPAWKPSGDVKGLNPPQLLMRSPECRTTSSIEMAIKSTLPASMGRFAGLQKGRNLFIAASVFTWIVCQMSEMSIPATPGHAHD